MDASLRGGEGEPARRFALDLFLWLLRAGESGPDIDNDGLAQRIEDRNGNGKTDPGETNPTWTDTDHDGIPDGLEDRNANGRVDPGETSPVNPDSDDDGIYDGADSEPLPAFDAPVVSHVEPGTCPAQGGMAVVLAGLNLGSVRDVWFGPERAPLLEPVSPEALVAVAPLAPGLEPSIVDIRVAGPAGEYTLPEGFRYAPLSAVTVRLASSLAPFSHRAGALDISVKSLDGAPIGSATLLLTVEPDRALLWDEQYATRHTGDGRASVRRTREGHLWLRLNGSGRTGSTSLSTQVPWRLAPGADGPVKIRVSQSLATAPHGIPLDSNPEPSTLRLP
jgi:hypothetical protein